jgi:FkbM family methyltransferase
LRRLVEKLDPFARLSYSHEGEDMVLRRIFQAQTSGLYVDVGAHHPFRFSNTCYFHRLGWRGINIDPNPTSIEAFRRVRPLDVNLCVGVSDVPGDLRYYVFNEPALNSFDPVLAAERALLRDYLLLETRDIPVRRLDDLLAEHLRPGQKIDFMSVDVEGLDLQVLKSNDWQRFRPRIMLAEARAANIVRLEADPVNAFATSIGYRLIAKTLNTLIYEDGSSASSSSATS